MTEGGVSRADRTERLVFPCHRSIELRYHQGFGALRDVVRPRLTQLEAIHAQISRAHHFSVSAAMVHWRRIRLSGR
jgi:hypothetical protein